jgi:hypothetical protein
MYKQVMAFECRCDLCGHRWISEAKPVRCAKCKSRIWNCDDKTVDPVVVESRSPGAVVSKEEKPKPIIIQEEAKPAARSSGCLKCGALGGVHMKGCK